MQRVHTDKWRRLLSVSAPAGNQLLVGMIENGGSNGVVSNRIRKLG
jgi:hypothetical protein